MTSRTLWLTCLWLTGITGAAGAFLPGFCGTLNIGSGEPIAATVAETSRIEIAQAHANGLDVSFGSGGAESEPVRVDRIPVRHLVAGNVERPVIGLIDPTERSAVLIVPVDSPYVKQFNLTTVTQFETPTQYLDGKFYRRPIIPYLWGMAAFSLLVGLASFVVWLCGIVPEWVREYKYRLWRYRREISNRERM